MRKKSYGYRNCKSLEELQRDFVDLYENQVIPFVKEGLCASVYTQISDVEEEINGVMTYDRKVVKLSPTDAMSIAKKLKI